MFKRSMSCILLTIAFALRLGVEAAPAATPAEGQKANPSAATDDKYEIMKRDQREGTDVFAIPLDESDIEDEEQIDRDEKKDVFPLPHSR